MTFTDLDFACFSGTGNTLRVARRMAETFRQRGVTVRLHRMEATDPGALGSGGAVGLACPVAAQGTYPFVWAFVRALPPGAGRPAFFVDTLAHFSGGLVGPMRRIVAARGYRPLGACEIRMPNNFFPWFVSAETGARKVARGLDRAGAFANALLDGRTRWGRVPLLSDAMGLSSQSGWAWALLRRVRRLKLDAEACTKCGLCARLCPVANIRQEDGPPTFGSRCVLCMRCAAYCPAGAVTSGFGARARYHAVEATELLHEDDT